MTALDLRVAEAADHPAIAAGFARACRRPLDRILPKVRWALGANPSGASGIVAFDSRGTMVAHFGVTHVPMMIEGASAMFGRVYASWVAPEIRIAGVHNAFHEIDAAFRETFEGSAIAATFGTFEDSDWWTLRRLHDFTPIRSELVLERAPQAARPAPPDVDVVSMGECAAAFPDEAWGSCGATRSQTVMAFRTGGPFQTDACLVAVRGGAIAGLVVLRDDTQHRVVLDLRAAAGDAGAADALLDVAIGDGSRRVVFPHASRSPWFIGAQRKGFRVVRGDLPYVAVRPSKARSDASDLRERWDWSASDVGLRALPAMLCVEEVVTAAPIGTAAGRERHA